MAVSWSGPPQRWAVWAGCSAIVAAAAAEIAFASLVGSAPPWKYLSNAGLAVVWTVCGLLAVRRRPESRAGLLMVLLGPLHLLSALWSLGLPTDFPFLGWITVVSQLSSWIGLAVITQLWVSYPSGQIRRRSDRLLVIVAYIYASVSAVGRLFVMTPDPTADPRMCADRCSPSPVQLVQDPDLYRVVIAVNQALTFTLALWLVVALTRRYFTALPRERQALNWPFGAEFVSVVLFIVAILRWPQTDSGPVMNVVLYAAEAAVPVAFLVGLLRERLAFAGVADLVRDLGRTGPDQIQSGLATVLADPGLRVLFPVGSDGQYVDVDGQPVERPAPDGSHAVTNVGAADHPLAVLVHDPSLVEYPDLLDAAGAAANLALENARLQAEVRAQLTEVRASRARLVDVADTERRRLERDLHDGAQHRLLGMGMALQVVRSRTTIDPVAAGLIDDVMIELRSALQELRDLAQGIHPAVLTDQGLPAALGMLARRCSLPVEVRVPVAFDRPPPSVEATAYYVASEALQNTMKHAQASHAVIQIEHDHQGLVIDVIDDGVGGAVLNDRHGLRGLYDRVTTIDGTLTLHSPRGGGTHLHASLPWN